MNMVMRKMYSFILHMMVCLSCLPCADYGDY